MKRTQERQCHCGQCGRSSHHRQRCFALEQTGTCVSTKNVGIDRRRAGKVPLPGDAVSRHLTWGHLRRFQAPAGSGSPNHVHSSILSILLPASSLPRDPGYSCLAGASGARPALGARVRRRACRTRYRRCSRPTGTGLTPLFGLHIFLLHGTAMRSCNRANVGTTVHAAGYGLERAVIT